MRSLWLLALRNILLGAGWSIFEGVWLPLYLLDRHQPTVPTS